MISGVDRLVKAFVHKRGEVVYLPGRTGIQSPLDLLAQPREAEFPLFLGAGHRGERGAMDLAGALIEAAGDRLFDETVEFRGQIDILRRYAR